MPEIYKIMSKGHYNNLADEQGCEIY